MDPRERMNNLNLAVSAAVAKGLSETWTAIPVKITSYDATLQTAQVSSQIIPVWNNPITGQKQIPLPIPPINDCPVVFPHGGGFTLTFPIAAGDEGLLILADRWIDGWWSNGSPTPPTDLRMHDLSDGFVMVGPRSRPNAISSVSTTAVQLRNDAGTSYVQIDGSGNIDLTSVENIDLTSVGNITIQSPAGIVTIDANGLISLVSNGATIEIDAGANVHVVTPGEATVVATGLIHLVSSAAIALAAPPGTITANGNVLG